MQWTWKDRQPNSVLEHDSRLHPGSRARGRESGEQPLGVVPGGRSSSRSRPEAKSAAIVLMSWRKWWEFVKGGSRALEFEKGSKVNLFLLAKAGGLGRGWSRVLCTLPSGPWTSCPRPQAPGPSKGRGWAKGRGCWRQRQPAPQGDSERELLDGPATPQPVPAGGPSGPGDSRGRRGSLGPGQAPLKEEPAQEGLARHPRALGSPIQEGRDRQRAVQAAACKS